ncbi:MAG: response regulator [Planctomycetes bacterium]|nr:response regulator [Planctomycetota bacterium]
MNVLLVDDSGLSRKVQAKVLREVGLTSITEARNGLDALKKLEESNWSIDLILTDWNMPGMDGISLIQEIRKSPHGARLPIIVVSSEGENSRITQAFQVGASSYITKPFKKEVLQRKIQAVCAIAEIEKRQRQASPSGGPPLIEGDLERLGLAELVGFLNFSKKEGELLIGDGGASGLSLVGGEVKHAWAGDLQGEGAFHAIAGLQSGRFQFHEGVAPRGSTITVGTMALLIDAVRRLDEAQGGS